MNVYHVVTSRDTKVYVVVAKDVVNLVELFKKYANKSHWYSYDIISIVLLEKANMIQR